MSRKISAEEARAAALQSQGIGGLLWGKGMEGTLAAIAHLGYVQIDTLAVAARAHHHTLWSRVKNYREPYLDRLVEQKKIFEYWSHAASFLPMRDYRFSLLRKQLYAKGKSHWFTQDKKLNRYVLDRIKAEGPLQSKDFEDTSTRKGMWAWKPAKRALEQLFMEGKLMVVKRQGFQKVYDLTERVLPADVDTSLPSKEEFAEYLILTAARTHGLVAEKEIYYLRPGHVSAVSKMLKRLLGEGKLQEVAVEKNDNVNYFMLPGTMDSIKSKRAKEVHILSPFDNAVIQRKRLQQLFGFDFVIECYLPAPKRKYGYYCLPVLYGDKFVARLDPKADRESEIFYVKNFHAEPGFKPDVDFEEKFLKKLEGFAAFNNCSKIEWGKK